MVEVGSSCVLSWLILGPFTQAVQAQPSEQTLAGAVSAAGPVTAISSAARLDHGGCRRAHPRPPVRSSKSLFQPPDPQQETASSHCGVKQAFVQLVWPCHGQALGLTPPGALAAAHSSAQQPSGPPYRIPTCSRTRCRHHARAEHVWGCSPAAMLCNLCLVIHGSPGDRSRVGKMLNHSDTKAFPSSAGTCLLRCFDVRPLALIRAHHSTFCNLSVGGPGSLSSRDPPGLPLRSAVLVLLHALCLLSPISQQPP